MTDLFAVNTETKTVNARDLWKFLESKQDFSTWIKSRIAKYDFIENVDYTLLHKKMEQVSGAKHLKEYHISFDMAKELSMIENNNKGKQARRYFIAMEKKAKTLLPQSFSEALFLAANQAREIELQTKRLEAQAPKVEVYNQFIGKDTYQSIGDVAKLIGIGRNKLFEKLRELKILQSGRSRNIPYQTHIEAGRFVVKEFVTGDIVKAQTFATPKGIEYIYKKLGAV